MTSVVMILRIYALYLGNKFILGFLLCILTGQIIVTAWGIHFGVRKYLLYRTSRLLLKVSLVSL